MRAFLLTLIVLPAFAQAPVVDGSGREIRPPARVERVFAAGPPASVLVFAIAPDKLAGWTRAMRPNEAQFFEPRAKTDLIVDVGSTGASLADLAQRVQRQIGIPYALFDGREKELNEAKARAQRASLQPKVYYGRGPAGLQTGGRGSINMEVLEFLGARNAAAEARPGLVTVPFEQVLLWNPEVILTTEPNYWKSVWTDPRWRAVDAVARRRVFLSPHLPFGWFDFPPGANRLLGIWWTGRLLYPAAFDIDLRAKAAGFHRLFYHRAPSAAQLDALLGAPGVLPR